MGLTTKKYHFVFLIDTSASMETKIESVIKGIRILINKLKQLPDCYISVVSYNSQVEVLEKHTIISDIYIPQTLQTIAGDAIYEGLDETFKIINLWHQKYPESPNIVFLITDGQGKATNQEDNKKLLIEFKEKILDGHGSSKFDVIGFAVEGADIDFLKELLHYEPITILSKDFENFLNKLKSINQTQNIVDDILKEAKIIDTPTEDSSQYNMGSTMFFILILAGLVFFLGFPFLDKGKQPKNENQDLLKKAPTLIKPTDTTFTTIKDVAVEDKNHKVLVADFIAIEYLTKEYYWLSDKKKEFFTFDNNRGTPIKDVCGFIFSKEALKKDIENSKGVICIGNTSEDEAKGFLDETVKLYDGELRSEKRANILANCINEKINGVPVYWTDLGQHKKTKSKNTKYQRRILIAIITRKDMATIEERVIFKAFLKADSLLYPFSILNYSNTSIKDSIIRLKQYSTF